MFRLKGVLLRECVLSLLKMATEEKKHLQANTQYILSSLPLSSKWQNDLVSLEGSSNNTSQHPPPLIDCVQTFPFSLHLLRHVFLFRRFVSRDLFRTPGNQPGEVFLHPQNVTFTFPQGDVFESCGICHLLLHV